MKWVASAQDALDVYGAGKATYNLYQSWQDNGAFERADVWNLLAYVPFSGAVLDVGKFFAANKAIKNTSEGIDDVLPTTRKTVTKINCFVARTEILTIEGIKNIEDIKVGDWVIADDPTTPGEIEARQVLDAFVRLTFTLAVIVCKWEIYLNYRQILSW